MSKKTAPLEVQTGSAYDEAMSQDREGTRRADGATPVHGEDLYRFLFEGARDAVFVSDEGGRFTAVNAAAEALTGYSREELLGMRIPDLHAPEDLHAYETFHERILGGEPVLSEAAVRRKDGTKVHCEFSNAPLLLGGRRHMHTIARDVTGRKEAEQALQRAKDYADNLIDTANVIIVGLNPAGGVRVFNRAAERITGYAPSELMGRDWFEVIVPRDRYPEVWVEFARLKAGGMPRTFENPIVTKSGEERFIMWQNSEVREGEEIVGTISFGIDVTEQRQLESALRESEARYRTIFEEAGDYVIMLEERGQDIPLIADLNESALRLHGYTREEVVGKPVSLLEAEPIDEHTHIQRKAAMDSGAVVTLNLRHRRMDGALLDIEARTRRVWIGGRSYIVSIERDVTERRLAEEALRESEARYRALFTGTLEALSITDEGRILDVNAPWLAMHGFASAQEVLGMDILEVVLPEDRGLMARRRLETFSDQEPRVFEMRDVARDGSVLDVEVLSCTLNLRGRRVVLSSVRNVSARKRAEAALRASEERLKRMSSLMVEALESERRRMARELHDTVGQSLALAKLRLERARRSGPRGAESLEQGMESVQEALDLVRGLSLDLRPSLLDDLGLVPALRWYLDRHATPAGLEVRVTGPPPGRLPPEVEVACFRIAQEAFANTLRHAQARVVTAALEREGGEVVLALRDDGRGFDAEAAWEDTVRGGSMGLLIMRERAMLAGGRLRIRSEPGGGTEVEARFPVETEP